MSMQISTRHLPLLFVFVIAFPTLAGAGGSPSLTFKLDHFGYRPTDSKRAMTTADPGPSVEIRDVGGGTVYRIPQDGGLIASHGFDGVRSGDSVWSIDFDGFTAEGTFHLFSPTLGDRSYDFSVSQDVYLEPHLAALKAFYYQRCGTPKSASHAGAWADDATCHGGDTAASAAAGHTDRGPLDLSGGWHDAGDYNKYTWKAVADAVAAMLIAYEDNPGLSQDGDSNIPESSNGIPDLLDEVRWELDWLLKMQLPDGSVLERLRQDGFDFAAPPSADSVARFYHDPTPESTAVFAGTTAVAARVFANAGQSAYAATLESAALAAWSWLAAQGNLPAKVWAAAELYRLDASLGAARAYVDGYTDWSTQWLEMDSYEWWAAMAYAASPGATASVVTGMRSRLDAHVDLIFGWNDLYDAGMADWQYYWGSNRPRAFYGLFLLRAARLGSTGSQTVEACERHARDFLHYLHGRNTLNMLYLSNMGSFGGEHSSYQIFHGWFGNSADAYSAANHFGKPTAVTETAYPYFAGTDNHGVSDNKLSTHGPAPGFVPGGPNSGYGSQGGESTPPLGTVYLDRFYRDWADQIVWTARTWEITEPSISYQGPYVALSAYFVDRTVDSGVLFADDFESGDTSEWSAARP